MLLSALFGRTTTLMDRRDGGDLGCTNTVAYAVSFLRMKETGE